MTNNSEKQPVDRWLDAALTQYHSAEPDPGMETRLLRHLRATPQKSSHRAWRLVLATTSAFVLILVVMLAWHNRRQPAHSVAVNPAPQQKPAVNYAAVTPSMPMVSHKENQLRKSRSISSHAATQVRLAQFPSPQPLSPQEQALAEYVRQRPREAQLVARARAELLRRTLAEFEARDHDKENSSAFE